MLPLYHWKLVIESLIFEQISKEPHFDLIFGITPGLGGATIIFADAGDMHPEELVTAKVNVPVGSPDIAELVPVPVVTDPPGDPASVHVPDAGKSFKITLPVARTHVGCVIEPIVGAAGIVGWELITIFAVGSEVHPDDSVTV